MKKLFLLMLFMGLSQPSLASMYCLTEDGWGIKFTKAQGSSSQAGEYDQSLQYLVLDGKRELSMATVTLEKAFEAQGYYFSGKVNLDGQEARIEAHCEEAKMGECSTYHGELGLNSSVHGFRLLETVCTAE